MEPSFGTVTSTLPALLGNELRAAQNELAARWLDRVADRLTTDPTPRFPSRQLLEAVPLLIGGIAAAIEDPALEVTVSLSTVASALELGDVDRPEHLGALDILKKYEVLQGVLFEFVEGSAAAREHWGGQELSAALYRIARSISVLAQFTIARYMRLVAERSLQREQRLRAFNRLVAHELRNRIGAVRGAIETLGETWLVDRPEDQARMHRIVLDNTAEIETVLHDIGQLAVMDPDPRQQTVMRLLKVVAEVVTKLSVHASRTNVQIRIADDIPDVDVPAALFRLCLSNYISNGIKYHDASKSERYVELHAALEGDESQRMLVIQVRDNGIGVAKAARKRLFDRFFRAQKSVEVDGMGLGLSIVREMVGMFGGRAWAEFTETETIFAFAVPFRRASDRPRDPLDPVEG